MASRRTPLLWALVAAAWLAGCHAPLPPASPTATLPLPSSTPEPVAARVNGQPILLADYRAEVARFEAAQKALGIDLATLGDYRGRILQALIDQRLLAEAAQASGAKVDPSALEARVDQLSASLGGGTGMGAWLAANGYDLPELKAALAEEQLAQTMVQQIADGVPTAQEQVHARHILVATADQAETLRGQVASGADFAQLAQAYSLDLTTRPAGGDLGWFPKDYLTTPEVETAAFSLQPGEVAPVVKSALGYHVVQLIERAVRPLAPEALQKLRQRAVAAWLSARRAQAAIEVLITP